MMSMIMITRGYLNNFEDAVENNSSSHDEKIDSHYLIESCRS